jgi:hypothetical protein
MTWPLRPALSAIPAAHANRLLRLLCPGVSFLILIGRDGPKKPGKIVVGMQHRPTTCGGMAITPKKAADACHFCFTARLPSFRLIAEFGCSRFSSPWGQ